MGAKISVSKTRMLRVAGGMALLIILAVLLQSLILSFLNKISGNRTTDLLSNHLINLISENAENREKLLESVKEDYIVRALTAAFILDSNPGYLENENELNRMAKYLDVEEINIFNEDGQIFWGTNSEKYGYTFDSNEQMSFFKPMLYNKNLSMCQDITPSESGNKPMLYAMTWCLQGNHIIQVGGNIDSLLRDTDENVFSKMIESMPLYEGVTILILDNSLGKIVASTNNDYIGSTLHEIGIPQNELLHNQNHKEILTFNGYRNFFDFRFFDDYEIIVAYSTAPHILNFVVSLSLVFLYLLFAALAVFFLVRREEKLIFQSNTDELTGIFNRRAYEEDLISNKNMLSKDFIYALMDVNSLKIVNDTLGHEAGDEIIVGASSCMQRCFGTYGKVYRVGGDEFVAMIYASNDQFGKIKNDFENETLKWKGKLVNNLSISCGYVSVAQEELSSMSEIVALAEKRMYDDKAEFYKKKGVDRRGQKNAHPLA